MKQGALYYTVLDKSDRIHSEATGSDIINVTLGLLPNTPLPELGANQNRQSLGIERPVETRTVAFAASMAEDWEIGDSYCEVFGVGLTPEQFNSRLAERATA